MSLKILANDCKLVSIVDNVLASLELTSRAVSLKNKRSCTDAKKSWLGKVLTLIREVIECYVSVILSIHELEEEKVCRISLLM